MSDSNQGVKPKSLYSLLHSILNVGQKAADFLDEFWNSLRIIFTTGLIAKVSPYILGGIYFIMLPFNANEYKKKMIDAYYDDPNSPLYYLKLGIYSLCFALCCFGLALNIGMILAGGGFIAANLLFDPLFIIASLGSTFILSLGLHIADFQIEKQKEKKAHEAYDSCVNSKPFNPENANKLYLEWVQAYNEKLKAEREVGLSAVESLGSIIICTGLILSMASIVGIATVGTMGLAPIFIMVFGVCMGVASKIAEEMGFDFTTKIRKYFRASRLINWLGFPDDEPVIKHNPSLEANTKPTVVPPSSDKDKISASVEPPAFNDQTKQFKEGSVLTHTFMDNKNNRRDKTPEPDYSPSFRHI